MNSMKLTSSEIQFAEKYIQNLEKLNKKWPTTRWAMLFVGIILISTYFFNDFLISNFALSIDSAEIPHLGNAYDPRLVELFISKHDNRVFVEVTQILISLVTTIISIAGTLLVSYSVSNWNKHIKNSLTIKILRSMLAEQQKKAEHLTNHSLDGKN